MRLLDLNELDLCSAEWEQHLDAFRNDTGKAPGSLDVVEIDLSDGDWLISVCQVPRGKYTAYLDILCVVVCHERELRHVRNFLNI